MPLLRIALREFADFENAMAAQIKAFCAQRSDVAIEAVPLDLDRLHRAVFAGGLADGDWDLAMLITDWLPDAIGKGLLEKLNPYMAAAPLRDWPQGWSRSLAGPLDFDGNLYCIPYHDGPECLIYRRDLFEAPGERAAFEKAFGYALRPPRTWQEFEDVARFFTRPEQGLHGTVFACYPDGHNTLYDYTLQVWSRGGELHDDSGQPTFASPHAEAALDFYRRIARDARCCHPGSVGFDSVASGSAFLDGSVAMMVNWFGFASRADRAGGALAGRVGLAPIPCDPQRKPVSLSAFWNIGIGAGSRHKQLAYDFLRFLAEPEMDRVVIQHGAVGVRLSSWRDAEVQSAVPAFRKIEEISAGARCLPRSAALPAFAQIVDGVIRTALESDEPSAAILKRADEQARARNVHFGSR